MSATWTSAAALGDAPAAPLKVAFLLPHLGGGGVERVFSNYAGAFTARGHDTQLVLVADRRRATEPPEGVHVVDLGVRGSSDATLGLALPALIRYLRRERPDALCVGITSLNLTALVARRLSGVSTAVVVSEHVPPSVNLRTHPLKRLLPPLMRRWYPQAQAVFAVSRYLADVRTTVAQLPPERVATVYNPVVGAKLMAEAAQRPEHPFYGSGEPVVVAVGRLHPQKDFGVLLRAFHRLQQHIPSKLVILGEGEARAALEAEVARLAITDRVSLPGYVAAPGSYLAHADLFALSSLYEGFPTVLIEALACGCPVVSTDCPTGPHEILEGGRYGRLVPTGDPRGLAEAMRATLLTPLPTAVLRGRGLTFTVEAATEKLEELLVPAVRNASQPPNGAEDVSGVSA